MNPFFEISDLEEIGEHIDDILGSHLTPFHVEGRMAIAPLGMRSVFQQTIGQMDMAQTVSGQKERVSVIFTNLTDMTLIEDQIDIAVILLTNQSIIVWTLKTKSLLPSLYKREELPLFGKEG